MRSQIRNPFTQIPVALTAILLALSVLLSACGGAPGSEAAPSETPEAATEPESTPEPTPEPSPEPTPANETVAVHAYVPGSWQDPCARAWNDVRGAFEPWPGEPMEPDADAGDVSVLFYGGINYEGGSWYTIQIPTWATSFSVNANGGSVKTVEIPLRPGEEVWIEVLEDDSEEYYAVTHYSDELFRTVPISVTEIPPFARERIEFEDQIAMYNVGTLAFQTDDGEIKLVPAIYEYIMSEVEEDTYYSNFYDLYTGELILSADFGYFSDEPVYIYEFYYLHPNIENWRIKDFISPLKYIDVGLDYFSEEEYYSYQHVLSEYYISGVSDREVFHTIEEYRQFYEDAIPERYQVDSYALFGAAES